MFFSADFFSNSSVLINYNVLPQKSIKKTLNSKYNYYNIIYKKWLNISIDIFKSTSCNNCVCEFDQNLNFNRKNRFI